jgi:hypothetical protein
LYKKCTFQTVEATCISIILLTVLFVIRVLPLLSHLHYIVQISEATSNQLKIVLHLHMYFCFWTFFFKHNPNQIRGLHNSFKFSCSKRGYLSLCTTSCKGNIHVHDVASLLCACPFAAYGQYLKSCTINSHLSHTSVAL